MKRESNVCVQCNGQTAWQNVTFRYPFRHKVYNVKNFPAEVCSVCNEKSFHAKDLEKLDKQILKKESVQELEFSF
ncbi:MAG: YgiT-type zinc finger protein [Acidobacteriota bacterium]|jgi:YgiT-type zinc finger domain-containing protein|nr:YgiT-type zinc finger protein [Acidobacteriota bacterium]